MTTKDHEETTKKKETFQLSFGASKKKKVIKKKKPKEGEDSYFETEEDTTQDNEASLTWSNAPKEELVIPVQTNGRQSLLARKQQEQQEEEAGIESKKEQVDPALSVIAAVSGSSPLPEGGINADDEQAIAALQAQAATGGSSSTATKSSKMVIENTTNTFQSVDSTVTKKKMIDTVVGSKQKQPKQQRKTEDDAQQFQSELDALSPELQVDSSRYQQVPIADFGAAMLRGMGWQGHDDNNEKPNDADPSMPRPSRLGLGAIPKMEGSGDALPPTHSHAKKRPPKRQDQVQKEQRLQAQRQEYEIQRRQQIKLDKQQTMQVGSIVTVQQQERRAKIRQWSGVPGLNQILIQYEGSSSSTKVQKGSVQLVSRSILDTQPLFDDDNTPLPPPKEKEPTRQEQRRSRDREDDNHRSRSRRDSRKKDDSRKRSHREEEDDDDRRKRRKEDRRRDDRDRDRRRSDDNSRDDRDGKSRKRSRTLSSQQQSTKATTTWLIPNIRVRIVTSKLGKSYYKEKATVIDVTPNGTALLRLMSSSTRQEQQQLVEAPERYLETGLPKVGGNVCILSSSSNHKWAKGRLLERDSKANKGSVQVFPDLNIVTTSLDDMAEWCGPLDDDLEE